MTIADVSDTIVAKSDQLNADDLLGGPITVTIQRVSRGEVDQPIVLHIDGGHQPFKPCKTVRRILVAAWGRDARVWAGRAMTLYRDPAVQWAGAEVGGIRVSALSHLDQDLVIAVQVRRGHKQRMRIARLQPRRDLAQVLADAELTVDDLDRWRAANDRGPVAELDQAQQQRLADWLLADMARLDALRAEQA